MFSLLTFTFCTFRGGTVFGPSCGDDGGDGDDGGVVGLLTRRLRCCVRLGGSRLVPLSATQSEYSELVPESVSDNESTFSSEPIPSV